jgi:polyvinyl alcohol dehydrogenase (cytochrome)
MFFASTATLATVLSILAGPPQETQGERRAASSESDAERARYLKQDLLNHHADLDSALDARNVASLEQAWTVATEGNVTHTPLVDGDRIFFADWTGTVYAVDAASGETSWKQQVEQARTDWPWHGFAGTGAVNAEALFEASAEGHLFALRKDTGEVLWKTRFADDEHAGNAGRLTVFEGTVFVPVSSVEEALSTQSGFEPDFRGHVVAVDAASGEIRWNLQLAQPPHDGVGVWSGFAVDPRERTLWFTTSNGYTGEASELSDAFVAADLDLGRIRRYRQVYQHDVWTMAQPFGPDYAFGAAPQIFMARVDGEPRKLVAAGNKSGTFFVLDARTGEPVWTTTIGHGNLGGGILADASIGGDRIFLWGNEAFAHQEPEKHPMDVAAVDAATGKWLWVRPEAQPAGLTSAGFLAGDVYLVPSLDGKVRGYSATDGKTLWTSADHGSIGSSLWVADGRLLFGTGVPAQFGGSEERKGLVAYGSAATQATPLEAGAPLGRRVVQLVAKDNAFEPAELTVRPGQRLNVILVNRGEHEHSIEFELPSGEAELAQPIAAGTQGTVQLTAPTEPGTYVFYCPVGDHREKGMEGKLIVERQP